MVTVCALTVLISTSCLLPLPSNSYKYRVDIDTRIHTANENDELKCSNDMIIIDSVFTDNTSSSISN